MMRLRQMNNRIFLILSLLGCSHLVCAQKTFQYQALSGKIDITGFYKISLLPGFISKSKDDLSDVRLVGPDDRFVPYVFDNNLPQVEKEKFIGFRQVTDTLTSDTSNSFVIESSEKKPITALWVKLKNTAVTRLINLSGSDDLKKWYAIEENIPLQQSSQSNDGSYFQSLSFPASNYRYLKLLVNNRNKAPLKFLAAGEYISASTSSPLYWPISFRTAAKKTVNKRTYVTLQLKENYLINRIHISISNPHYYKRELSIYQMDSLGRHLIATAELNSNNQDDIILSAKTSGLELQIENGDNQPLTIDDVKIYQAGRYIISHLEKGKMYRLLTGDTAAKAPEYDLRFFTDSIRNIQSTDFSPPTRNKAYSDSLKAPMSSRSLIIWSAIITVLILLSLLTWKMINELNRKETHQEKI